MIGLAYILFFSVYGYLSVKAVKYAANWAAENGRSPRVWGFLAGFVMYNLVFWDFIPVYATHAYYCAKLGGLTVYKTPEEWTAENPGVAKMLTPFKTPVFADTNGKQVGLLNQRFSYTVEHKKLSMFHWIKYERIVDRDTRKTLVERRDITLRMRNWVVTGIDSIRSLKGWLMINKCNVWGWNRHKWLYGNRSFMVFYREYEKLADSGYE